jgi:hypothetical protein
VYSGGKLNSAANYSFALRDNDAGQWWAFGRREIIASRRGVKIGSRKASSSRPRITRLCTRGKHRWGPFLHFVSRTAVPHRVPKVGLGASDEYMCPALESRCSSFWSALLEDNTVSAALNNGCAVSTKIVSGGSGSEAEPNETEWRKKDRRKIRERESGGKGEPSAPYSAIVTPPTHICII